MKRKLLAALWTFLFTASVGAVTPATEKAEFALPGDIAKIQISVEVFDPKVKGVLVVAGGAVQPMAPGLEGQWRNFAIENHLALALVRLQPSPKIKVRPETILQPVAGAAPLLDKILKKLRLADKPLYLFGFREGGDFVSSLVASGLFRVGMWGCQAGTQFPAPARNTAYGVIAGNELDGTMYDHAKSYEEQSRRQGAAMAWISLPGNVSPDLKVDDFIRNCIASKINSPGARLAFVDNQRKTGAYPPSNPDAAAATSVLLAGPLYQDWKSLHQPSEIITITVPTGVKELPEIVMALRLPPNQGAGPTRILAYCYYFTSAGSVLQMARNDKAGWNQFAAERGLATLTWNVQTLWGNLKSFDQTGSADLIRQNREFDQVNKAWESGMMRLAKQYQLKDTNILMYGCSRGANFALRLVMRNPAHFSAVVAHIANSFERPVLLASSVAWAISNGQFDPGAPNARRYYDQCHAVGLPVFLRLFPNLGHNESGESLKFARGFFDCAIKNEKSGATWAAQLNKSLKNPAYVADVDNQLVFPEDKKDSVPEGQRMAIPNLEMTGLWGRLIP